MKATGKKNAIDGWGWQLDATDGLRFVKPREFMPRMCYFRNTYLGGSAAHEHQLKRLDEAMPGGESARLYRGATALEQHLDGPDTDGLALTAQLDHRHFDRAGRYYLQIGVRGSDRFGWRRPPLDVALVIDGGVERKDVLLATMALLDQLGAADRLGIYIATEGQPFEVAAVDGIDEVRAHLAQRFDTMTLPSSAAELDTALAHAGERLRKAADAQARIPGSQTLLVLTPSTDPDRIARVAQVAHRLTVEGAITSVIQLGGSAMADWWRVADLGYGNYHRAEEGVIERAVADELSSLSRVVARLVRLTIRLGPHTSAIRVLGSEVLGQREVKQVKAREEAIDRNLSRTLGVKADRGDDDDGVQTVIPYFYGGDSHIILVELWVDEPGPVAELSLKYKDMVNLSNASARTSVQLSAVPVPATAEEDDVRRNLRAFEVALLLEDAAEAARVGQQQRTLDLLGRARRVPGANQTDLMRFERLVGDEGRPNVLNQALLMASQRQVGMPAGGAGPP